MGKSTHLPNLTSNYVRVGGAGKHLLGGQPIPPPRVPSNWYPNKLPAASAGTPQNSDVATLLDSLSPLVAMLTIQQSVFLANVYRTVQVGVVAGGTFKVNSVASATTTSWFDQSISISEAVAVDVVNKNPALTYDLALRLATQAARQIDKQIAAVYAGFTTIAAVGAQGTTPSAANLVTQINALPNTGEPVLGVFNSQIAKTTSSFQTSSVLSALLVLLAEQVGYGSETAHNAHAPLFNVGANKLIRLMASDNVAMTGTTTQTSQNLVFLPSGLAFASADQGTSTGSGGGIAPSGTVAIRASNWFDTEYANQPQLSLQLVCGNTGSGVQTVYVNCLGAGICINAGNGAVVNS